MAISYGVEYLAPETINPVFNPQAFLRAYKQQIDQVASTSAIQAELDTISNTVNLVETLYSNIGLVNASPYNLVITVLSSGLYSTLYGFSLDSGQSVAVINNLWCQAVNGGSSNNKISTFCTQLYNSTSAVVENCYYWTGIFTQTSGSLNYWFSQNTVLIRNTYSTTQSYVVRVYCTYSGMGTGFTVSGPNTSQSLCYGPVAVLLLN
jgi:hypothetical protein